MAFRLVQPRPSRNQGAHTASGIGLGKSAAKLSETNCHWRCTPAWPRCKVQAKRCWLWVSSLRCARYDHIICAATTLNFGRVNMVFVLQTSSLRWIAACVNRYRCDLRLCGLGITELVVKLCEDTYDSTAKMELERKRRDTSRLTLQMTWSYLNVERGWMRPQPWG